MVLITRRRARALLVRTLGDGSFSGVACTGERRNRGNTLRRHETMRAVSPGSLTPIHGRGEPHSHQAPAAKEHSPRLRGDATYVVRLREFSRKGSAVGQDQGALVDGADYSRPDVDRFPERQT